MSHLLLALVFGLVGGVAYGLILNWFRWASVYDHVTAMRLLFAAVVIPFAAMFIITLFAREK